MIQIAMLIALGFLLACLLALALAGPYWRRAVRLTTKRLEATMPMSLADIQADKDQLRAEYAVKLRALEQSWEREREKAARFLVDRNKHAVTIARLEGEVASLKNTLEERSNETSVLEQTIQKRIPDLQEQLNRAGQIIATRDSELARMTTAYENQTEALGIAKKSARTYMEEIDRLRDVLEGGDKTSSKLHKDANEALVEQNHQLHADISRLRMELTRARDFAIAENVALREELHTLASQIMDRPDQDAKSSRTPARSQSRKKSAKEKQTEPGDPPAEAEDTAAGAAPSKKEDTSADAKPAKPKRRSRRTTRKKSGPSLSERLKKLSPREKA